MQGKVHGMPFGWSREENENGRIYSFAYTRFELLESEEIARRRDSRGSCLDVQNPSSWKLNKGLQLLKISIRISHSLNLLYQLK